MDCHFRQGAGLGRRRDARVAASVCQAAVAEPLRIPYQQGQHHDRARLSGGAGFVPGFDQRSGPSAAVRDHRGARPGGDRSGRAIEGISPLAAPDQSAAPAASDVVVDRPQYRPPARQLLRHLRCIGVFGAQCGIAAPAVAAHDLAQLRRDRAKWHCGGPHHVRPSGDGRCHHRPRARPHGANSQLGHS